jgi:hypothetical protein
MRCSIPISAARRERSITNREPILESIEKNFPPKNWLISIPIAIPLISNDSTTKSNLFVVGHPRKIQLLQRT